MGIFHRSCSTFLHCCRFSQKHSFVHIHLNFLPVSPLPFSFSFPTFWQKLRLFSSPFIQITFFKVSFSSICDSLPALDESVLGSDYGNLLELHIIKRNGVVFLFFGIDGTLTNVRGQVFLGHWRTSNISLQRSVLNHSLACKRDAPVFQFAGPRFSMRWKCRQAPTGLLTMNRSLKPSAGYVRLCQRLEAVLWGLQGIERG